MNDEILLNKSVNNELFVIKTTEDLIPGDVVLHPVYRMDGLLLVGMYTVLNTSLIHHIKIHLSNEVRVLVAETRENFKKFIDNTVYLDASFLKTLRGIVEALQTSSNLSFSIRSFVDERVDLDTVDKPTNLQSNFIEAKKQNNLVNKIISFPLWLSLEKILDSEQLKARVKTIQDVLVNKILVDDSVLKIIRILSDYDERLLIHGTNTACISVLIGLTLELTDEEIINLAFAAMFCNVGFTKIEKNEFEQFLYHHNNFNTINNHIKNSVEIISSSRFCRSKSIIYGIIDHHEKYNGKGLPANKSGENISLFGRIIAIAMRYDELTSGHDINGPLNVRKATKTILDNNHLEFDPNILRIFISRTNIYKIGLVINLENGTKGTIIGFSDFINYPQKPIVQLSNGTIVDYSML
jgi:HD-GYP domain-containing protein (c-di-GMP phosphodiesterase class II)